MLREFCVLAASKGCGSRAGSKAKRVRRGKVTTPIPDISAPKLATILRGKKTSVEVEEGEWGRKGKCPQASHWTGVSSASKDLGLAQRLPIGTSRSPVISDKAHRSCSGAGPRGRSTGGSDLAFTEVHVTLHVEEVFCCFPSVWNNEARWSEKRCFPYLTVHWTPSKELRKSWCMGLSSEVCPLGRGCSLDLQMHKCLSFEVALKITAKTRSPTNLPSVYSMQRFHEA